MWRRIWFALDLVHDDVLIAEYERAHGPGAVWPEIARGIRERGFSTCRSGGGDRPFMIATGKDNWPRQLDADAKAVDAQWVAAMGRFSVRYRSRPMARNGCR